MTFAYVGFHLVVTEPFEQHHRCSGDWMASLIVFPVLNGLLLSV